MGIEIAGIEVVINGQKMSIDEVMHSRQMYEKLAIWFLAQNGGEFTLNRKEFNDKLSGEFPRGVYVEIDGGKESCTFRLIKPDTKIIQFPGE